MYVSMTRPMPGSEGQAEGPAPHTARDMIRRLRMAGALRMLPLGGDPDPADTALFRMLLSDSRGKEPAMQDDRKDVDLAADLSADVASFRPDRQDEIVCVTGRHGGIERQEARVHDPTAIAALDLAALGGVVAKVYLDSLHDRQRGVAVALDEQLLPATRLSVLEQEGRLAVEFVSVNQRSRERLRRGAPALAQRVARELSRDVCVKVAAHDADRQALEVRADTYTRAVDPVPRADAQAHVADLARHADAHTYGADAVARAVGGSQAPVAGGAI